jgi:hypothetical protein
MICGVGGRAFATLMAALALGSVVTPIVGLAPAASAFGAIV